MKARKVASADLTWLVVKPVASCHPDKSTILDGNDEIQLHTFHLWQSRTVQELRAFQNV